MTVPTIAYEPHAWQRKIHKSTANNRVVVAGRQSGKTVAAVAEVSEWAMSSPARWPNDPRPQFWWTTATYKTKGKAYRDFEAHIPKEIVVKKSEEKAEFHLRNGATISFRSADGKDSLVSERLHGLVADEFCQYDPVVYHGLLAPMLGTTGGPAIFTGTPRGHNWGYRLYQNALNGASGWEAFRWRTADSPFVLPGWLADRQRDTPEREWRQEYEAEFLEDGGAVFRNVDAAIAPEGVPDAFTVLGVDCALTNDWFVIWACNSRGEWVYFDRFQRVDWPIAKLRVVEAYRRLKASRVLIDISGMNIGGSAVVVDLQSERLVVDGITISGPLKRGLIDTAMLRFEQGALTIPGREDVLEEFKSFASVRMRSGAERFSAPEGEHDDIVTACALALWGIRQFAGKALPKPKSEVEALIERDLRARISGATNPWLT